MIVPRRRPGIVGSAESNRRYAELLAGDETASLEELTAAASGARVPIPVDADSDDVRSRILAALRPTTNPTEGAPLAPSDHEEE